MNMIEMNRVGMVLDVSHTGYREFMEAIEVSVNRSLCHIPIPVPCIYPRNVPDEQIKAMAATGGVIGVVPINVILTVKVIAHRLAVKRCSATSTILFNWLGRIMSA